MLRGYVDKKRIEEIEGIREKKRFNVIYRFDLGQNNDGCAPEVARHLAKTLGKGDCHLFLKDYPDLGAPRLVKKIAELHEVPVECVRITAGVEQAIGLIANALICPGDFIAVNEPSFYVFSKFSLRVGARPLVVPLEEKSEFQWGWDTVDAFRHVLRRQKVRIAWLADPNNPTGRSIPEELLEEMVAEAEKQGCLVVVDEAYGEYTDPPGGIRSASSLLSDYPNLVVLRTFSKAYGLAGLRIGYILTQNEELLALLDTHGYNFPVSELAVEAATEALGHPDYLETTRRRTQKRAREVIDRLNELESIVAIPTECCIFVVRHRELGALGLSSLLEEQGIITSAIPGTSSIHPHYIRVTIGRTRENRILLEAFARIDGISRMHSRRSDDLGV